MRAVPPAMLRCIQEAPRKPTLHSAPVSIRVKAILAISCCRAMSILHTGDRAGMKKTADANCKQVIGSQRISQPWTKKSKNTTFYPFYENNSINDKAWQEKVTAFVVLAE